MRCPPVTTSFLDTISIVVKKMILNNIGSIIVMRKGPIGIITESDIVKILDRNKNISETIAEELMSKPLVWIESDESLKNALKMMHENGVRRLAVTKNGILVGIVTERRILRVFLKNI
jgi:arabinose-5-phosphate isomerase